MSDWKNIHWDQPWLLLLLLLLPLLAWCDYVLSKPKGMHALSFSHLGQTWHRRTWRTAGFRWLPVLIYGAIVALTVALARPQLKFQETLVSADGIDIMLVIDLSSSMLARDFQPDRLEVCKRVAAQFVQKRTHDHIGMVVFAGESFTMCPLTSDHAILTDFINELKCGFLEDGTAIGMGLAMAVNRLKDSQASSKVVILLTDGDNNAGYVSPMTAAQIATEMGVKVYTIGVGTQGMALTPQSKRTDGTYVFDYARVVINEDILQTISDQTGGAYFRATDEASLQQIYDIIDSLEKTEREVSALERYKDLFVPWLLTALLLVALHLLLSATAFRVFP